MSDYDLINGEILTVTVTVDEETVIANINTAARGPAGTSGSGAITSATTSDGTADLDLLNVETVTATVSGTLTAPHIHGNLAGSVYAHIRAGENLAKGDPVYVSSSHGSGSTLIPIVSKADASNAAKMPAVGIMDAAVANNANGHMVITGTITELDTDGLTVNAELYVAEGGGMTATPPTARAQPVARVERVNANNGAVIVKVNGLSASDATGNTLVRRTSGGGASFAGINTNSGSYSQVGGANFNVATTTAANLTATGSGTVTVSGEGGTTISGGTLTFSPSAPIEQRNGTAQQESRIYGTYTGAGDYRRLALKMSTAGVAQIVAEGAGSGAVGNVLQLHAGTQSLLELSLNSVQARSTLTVNGVAAGGSANSGQIYLGNSRIIYNSGKFILDDFNNSSAFIALGGASATSAALKKSTGSTTLNIRLGDDSEFAPMQSLYQRFGSGSPEGLVTAPIGAVFHRTDGGAGTSFYVKESGTGNTGWVAK
jgi:hypothetical protein